MITLRVFAAHTRVGALVQRDDDGLRFTYDATWLAAPGRFAISRSLPLRAQAFDREADRFFGNLLPEGPVRTAVCRRLHISEDNDFALLRAIGRECAGALVLSEADDPGAHAGSPRALAPEDVDRWSSTGGYAAAVADELRLSLAGAQDKVGVVADGDALWLPDGDSPSTHLLKLPSRDFAALPENEALVLELARRVDLPTVESRLWTASSTPALLVTRFDRRHDGGTQRLHQEDFCQALAIDRRRKYEAEGGPSFAQCVQLVREASADPLTDTRALLRWLAFCAVVGNRDNHAKNLALVRDDVGRWRLAPFYDLLCTTAYERLDRRLAMSIGGRRDGGNLPEAAWHDEAARLTIKPRYLGGLVSEVADAVARELPAARDAISDQLGSDHALADVQRAIGKGIRAVRRSARAR